MSANLRRYLAIRDALRQWYPASLTGHAIIHRTERCDLSLFQLGLRLLEHFLNEGMPITVAFTVFLFADEEHAWMAWVCR